MSTKFTTEVIVRNQHSKNGNNQYNSKLWEIKFIPSIINFNDTEMSIVNR